MPNLRHFTAKWLQKMPKYSSRLYIISTKYDTIEEFNVDSKAEYTA